MVHYEFTETVSDNGSEQELSIDSSPKEVYCEDCDKARSNGGNIIENQESLDHVKSLTETHVKLPFPPTILPKDLVNALLNSKSQSPKISHRARGTQKVEKLYIDARNERLRSEKADEQNKSFANITNPTPTNSTIAVSDDFSNGPTLPTEVKSCASSEQSANTNPYLDATTFVPYDSHASFGLFAIFVSDRPY
ncbi:1053_t:CDS:2 [Racocetra fulgida]|uniref:1053_t:CDS:1 n=1 Tax=Racocetra fulgida TaxID=60492 RepID=A0A9N8YWF3_9GLOM|nr:1053_t:CDS:2 [Racocetra fulgida]